MKGGTLVKLYFHKTGAGGAWPGGEGGGQEPLRGANFADEVFFFGKTSSRTKLAVDSFSSL